MIVQKFLHRCVPKRGVPSRLYSSKKSPIPTTTTTPTTSVLNTYNVFDTIQQHTDNDEDDQAPRLPSIQRCGQHGFTVGNVQFRGGLMLANGGILLWDAPDISHLKVEHFVFFDLLHPLPDILVLGTGENMVPLSEQLLNFFRKLGVQVEVMNSRKACATYNILVEEDRNVAAALLPLVPTSAREPNLPSTPAPTFTTSETSTE